VSRFHPELRRAAKLWPRAMVTPRNLAMIRSAGWLLARRTPPDVEVLTLPSGIDVWLYRPPYGATPGGDGPALLWIHGGGYVIGGAWQDDANCRRFARELGATVAAVNYRLAPEYPYPTPLEDCYDALTWLAELPAVDSGRLAIGGASAGGGLAAALALLARDRGGPALAGQLLVYPMLDDRSGHAAPTARDEGFRLWDRASNRWGWSCYLGDADPNAAVPARRDDLSGLPPAWVGVGTNDLFHDEDLAYARRLRTAGVPCELHVEPAMYHGADAIVPDAPSMLAFRGRMVTALRAALA
jgi:acetyl esterase/lipase